MINYNRAVKAGWTKKGRRVNYSWWAKWSNALKYRNAYVRRLRVTAARNMAIAKR